MGYSLAAKFASETLAMCLTILIGESIIANELLPSTKGHAMGLLGVALGFGLAFGVNIAWFGFISAHLNPAMFFFLALLGKLEHGWAEFAVGSAGDFLGAFLGACLVYVFYAPHFWTVPLPRDDDPVSVLVHGMPDALSGDAARIASAFGTDSKRPRGAPSVAAEARDLAGRIRGGGIGRFEGSSTVATATAAATATATAMEAKDGLGPSGASDGVAAVSPSSYSWPWQHARDEREVGRLLAKMEVRRRARGRGVADASVFYGRRPACVGGTNGFGGGGDARGFGSVGVGSKWTTHLGKDNEDGDDDTSVRSIQVAGLLRRHDPSIRAGGGDDDSDDNKRRHSVQIAPMLHEHDPELGEGRVRGGGDNSSMARPVTGDGHEKARRHLTLDRDSDRNNASFLDDKDDDGAAAAAATTTTNGGGSAVIICTDGDHRCAPMKHVEDAHNAAFLAAIEADAHAKLSIFATRPAKYNRVANFVQEAIATLVLLFGAEMFNVRREYDRRLSYSSSTSGDGPYVQALFLSLYITAVILGLGGTTGLAVNPARDFGPRLAHALLPIPGKGGSEWHYAWVPFFASYVGAALGALLLWAVEELYKTGSV